MAASENRAKLSNLPTYSSTSTSRLQSLYSDIGRQRASNPTSFQSNVEWWRRSLEAIVTRGSQSTSSDVLILHAGPQLSETFRYEGVGKPLGLAAVITELKTKQTLIPLNTYSSLKSSIYDPGSLAYRVVSYVVGKPLWWALRQMNIVDGEDTYTSSGGLDAWKDVKGAYVCVSILEKAADAVVDRHHAKASTLADSLYSLESFKKEFAAKGVIFPDVSLSDTDLTVLVKYLSRDRKAVVVDKEVIKFIDTEDEASEQTVSVVDKGILELKNGVEDLEAAVVNLQTKIKDRNAKVTAVLRENRKEVAMAHLRTRKQYEELLSKRLGALETLHTTLIQVETAAGDVEIMKRYEASTATLRAILSHPSLQREKIEETMDAMASARQDHQEMDEIIRTGTGMEDIVDESELANELAGLVAEVQQEEREKKEKEELARKEKEEERERLREREREKIILPDVPSTPPLERQPSLRLERTTSRSSQKSVIKAEVSSDWERNWQKGQDEKSAQAFRDRELEGVMRAKWESQKAQRQEVA